MASMNRAAASGGAGHLPHGGVVGAEGASLALGDERGLLGIAQELVAVAAVIGTEGDPRVAVT